MNSSESGTGWKFKFSASEDFDLLGLGENKMYSCNLKIFVIVRYKKSKPAAKKWMTTTMLNYTKMVQLWAKDRVKSDHAETAKEKRARYAGLTTIDEIDNLISQNEVSLENFEVEDD
nr:hypothetical protein CFP56_31116 [Quercus suber]